jgi:predicted MFS family arabinose efflux permease
MLIAGVFFLVGTILDAAAQDLAMLIIGRLLLGCGVGFAHQVTSFTFLFLVVITSLLTSI